MKSSRALIQGCNSLAVVEDRAQIVVIADREYWRRQPTYAAAARHKERHNRERRLHRSKLRRAAPPAEKKRFAAEDFSYERQVFTKTRPHPASSTRRRGDSSRGSGTG